MQHYGALIPIWSHP